MANIESIKTDMNKETNGVWVDYAVGIQLLIARARNPRYLEVLRNLADPLTKDIRNENVSIEEFQDLLLKVRAKTILLGWENIESKDGNMISYSSNQAEKFFKDPELRDFYEFVVTVSESAEQFKKDIVEDSEKN